MITKSYRNHNTNITFEQIFRHTLDQQVSGRPMDPMDLNITLDRVNDAMLDLIKRKSLMDELLVDLGLCSLCHERKKNRRTAAAR